MKTLQKLENRTVEPIVADNLVLDGEAVRGADGEYLIESQRGFEKLFTSQNDGRRLPTVQEYITIFKELEQINRSALEGLLKDLSENSLCTATKIDYRNSNLPLGNGYLDQLVKDPAWRTVLQDEVFQYDAPEAIEVLQKVIGKRSYISTPSAEDRKSHPERAVWVSAYTDGFYLGYGSLPISTVGRSRGVRGEAPSGAVPKNEDSSNQKDYPIQRTSRDRILTMAKPCLSEASWPEFEKIVPRDAPVYGDVMQRAEDNRRLFSEHSWERFKIQLGELYK